MADDELIESLTRNFRTKISQCPCGCWLFSSVDRNGYGQFKIKGRNVIAHRYAYEQLVGPIPTDETVDHICDRHRNCVNPAHFELVTRSENSRRANDRRWNRADSRESALCTPTNQGDMQ